MTWIQDAYKVDTAGYNSWGDKSKRALNKSFGDTSSTANSIGGIASTAATMATNAFSLASPSQTGVYNQVKSNTAAVNNYRINSTSLDEIDNIATSWTPLKTNYKWSDFYANGGYLTRPHKYSAGGRMAGGMISSTASGAATGASIGGPWGAVIGGAIGLVSSGIGALVGHGKASRMARRANAMATEANEGMQYKLDSAVGNAKWQNHLSMLDSNPYAYGGLMDLSNGNMGAIEYGMMSDYLTMKDKQAQNKNNFIGYLGNNNTPSMFALGGDIQTNGADFTTGLNSVNAGGSHESNPYEGVQLGVAPDGAPNLVEEGEAVYDDYVFSDRLKPSKEVLKKFHLSARSNMTYADVAKKLEKEAKERPNDPISQNSLRNMLAKLAEAQEEHKAKLEAEKAREAFEALSPEEQQQVLAQIAQQQQAEQQAAQQQVSSEEQQMAEEQAMQEQQAMQGQQEVPVDENSNPVEMQPQEEVQYAACGGKLAHKFPTGGDLVRNKLGNILKLYTQSDWDKWQKDNGIEGTIDFEKIKDNPALMDAITKANPSLAYVLGKGYDFGANTYNSTGYDLEAFNKALGNYTKSRTKGNTAGNYAIDKEFGIGDYKTIKDYEASDPYKAYTNAMLDIANAAQGQKFSLNKGVLENVDGSTFSPENLQFLNTLYNTAQGTSTFDKGDPVPLFTANDDGTYSIVKDASDIINRLRYDGKGGIFHLNPNLANRGNQVVNYVQNADGSIEKILGDVPAEWKKANTYSWATDKDDITNNFYTRPEAPADTTGDATKDKVKELAEEEVAKHRPEWMRYAGLLGPAAGLGLWSAGVGKPNTAGLDKAFEYASQANGKADYRPIGNYLRYRPLDVWAEQNRMSAQSNATNRAIINNNSTTGSKMAGLLANGYTGQLGSANLYRSALEYNDAKRKEVAEFNRATDMFNAQAYNDTSKTNAELKNRNIQFKANLAADIARQKMAADSQWNQALYGNIGELTGAIADIGRENAQFNMIANMAANGLAGNMSSNTPVGSMYLKKKKTAACGGKLKRRKGLTF